MRRYLRTSNVTVTFIPDPARVTYLDTKERIATERECKNGEGVRQFEQIGEELIVTSDGRTAVKVVRVAGSSKRPTCHRFRHSFATHQLSDGYDIRTMQKLMAHKDVRTTTCPTKGLQEQLPSATLRITLRHGDHGVQPQGLGTLFLSRDHGWHPDQACQTPEADSRESQYC